MKKMILLAMFSFATFAMSAKEKSVKTEAQLSPTIRVLLAESLESALIEVRGPYSVSDVANEKHLSAGRIGKRYPFFMIDEGLRWGEEYPDVYTIAIHPKSAKTYIYVNGMQYKGSLIVYGREDKTIAIVNEVAIEDFVDSSLSSSFSPQLSKEALAALAIQTRTWAYQTSLDGRKQGWLWDTFQEQANYFGRGLTRHQEVEQALIDTAHIVVLEGNIPKNIQLTPDKAQELAGAGLNARDIIKKCGGKNFGSTVGQLR